MLAFLLTIMNKCKPLILGAYSLSINYNNNNCIIPCIAEEAVSVLNMPQYTMPTADITSVTICTEKNISYFNYYRLIIFII